MSTKFDLGSTLVGKLIIAAASAGVLGGGTAVISTARENAVQAEQIATVQKQQADLSEAVKSLRDTTQQLDKNVAVLNERLK